MRAMASFFAIIVGTGCVDYDETENPYLALVAWAFYGVSLKRGTDFPQIALTAKLAMVGVILASVWIFYRRRAVKS
jgi:hypothetical protein